MARDVTSNHLKGATELTLIADIKSGLVDVRETLTYATRLRVLLRTLFALRQTSVETARGAFVGPLEKLQSLHFVRWSILENRQLMLAVAFDGPWEPYMRRIVDVAGPLLDVILCNCKGFDAHASDKGHEKFVQWVRDHQVETEFFHSGFPDTTVDDIRYLKRLEASQIEDPAGLDAKLASFQIRDLSRRKEGDEQPQGVESLLRGLTALHRLTAYYPESDVLSHHIYLLRTAHLMFGQLKVGKLPPPLQALPAVRWFESLEPRVVPEPEPVSLDPEARATVQGNILDSEHFEGMTHGCLLLMRVRDRAKAKHFLLDQVERLRSDAKDKVRMNLGFTFAGLANLGVPAGELAQLPKEFREGMEARAGMLGDVGPNHPEAWRTPVQNWPVDAEPGRALELSTVDFVIQLQVKRELEAGDHLWSEKHALYRDVAKLAREDGVELLAVEVQRRKLDPEGYVREHFGYRDGLSQPKPEGSSGDRDRVSLGEILLGHPNDRGDSGGVSLPFLENGSFLVIRKLEQNVAAFRKVVEDGEHGRPRDEATQREIMGKMMGRYPSGEPVHQDGGADPENNDFDFGSSARCPFDSHIRRANPRTEVGPRTPAGTRPAPLPRILRRGFSYGLRDEEQEDPGEAGRGLFFMAYNASIAEQFEVIQRWMSGGNSTRVLSAHSDPFLGLPTRERRRTFRYGGDAGEAPSRVELGDEPLVTLRWGMYLFVPSTNGLTTLADLLDAPRKREPFDVARGQQVIAQLEGLARFAPAHVVALEWKKLLEDFAARDAAADVWAAIRAGEGALRTPYGVLLAGREEVMTAFREQEKFSVREYWERMRQSIGALYLGMDREPQPIADGADARSEELDTRYREAVGATRYGDESLRANRWIFEIEEEDAFGEAQKETRKWLGERTALLRSFTLGEFIGDVLAKLSARWFVLPDGELMQQGGPVGSSPAHCPDGFLATARYIFSPNPTEFVQREGRTAGRALLQAARDVVAKAVEENDRHSYTLFHHLAQGTDDIGEIDQDLMARALVGSVHGFVGPCYGSLFSVLYRWLNDGSLWRLQQSLAWEMRDGGGTLTLANASNALRPSLVAAMQAQPLPYILHRTVLQKTSLGGVALAPGDRVVLGLLSGTQEASEEADESSETEVLFGGTYDSDRAPLHACPGQKLAIGVILGMLATLMEYGTLKRLDTRTIELS